MSQGNGYVFNNAFNKEEIESIPFNPAWCNSTGYFDNICFAKNKAAPSLAPGELKKFIDNAGRRAIVIGTRFGNVCVFDRFAGQTDSGVWVTNAPKSKLLSLVMSGSSVGEVEMITLLGGWGILSDNIGFAIENIANEFGK